MFSGSEQVTRLRRAWSSSKVFRVVLVAVIVFTLLRLVVQGVLLLGALLPPPPDMPDAAAEDFIPADLQIYLNAARHFQQRQDLYLQGSLARLEEHYPYAPSFALAFTPFLWFSPGVTAVIHTLLHIVAYALLYFAWARIFRKLRLERACDLLAWTLPVWLLFAAFWGDLVYLNIYVIMALVGTLFIEAVLEEKLGAAVLWLAIILQIKPHWAFAAAVPLLLGRWRFFVRLIGYSVPVYAGIVGIVLLVGGVEYGWQQHVDYLAFLSRLSRDFPWRGPEAGFLGYNHSITQIVVYLLGVSAESLALATAVKLILLVPLALVGLRCLRRPARRPGIEAPILGLDLAFALYLGAFIWLDMVWEVTLGIAVFTYLLATLERRGDRALVWAVFLPYALVDFWQTVSYLLFGPDVIVPGPYLLTDPSIYLPLIMIVILVFYALLIRRLWRAPAANAG